MFEENDNGGDPPGGGEPAAPAWVSALQGSVSGLDATMKEMMATARQAREEMSSRTQQPPADNEEEADEGVDPTELETMSRADFSKTLMSQMLKVINKQVVAPLNQQLQELTAATTRRDIHASVAELSKGHKDYWDWKDEMIALANENRGLAPQRLYQLARADNPDKAKELDKKYNPPAASEGGRIRLRAGFGGLTPGQSGGGSKGAGKMNGTQASDAAWAETVAALGGEPMFED